MIKKILFISFIVYIILPIISYFIFINFFYYLKIDIKSLKDLSNFTFSLVWWFLGLYVAILWYLLSFRTYLKRLKISWPQEYNRRINSIKLNFYLLLANAVISSAVYLLVTLKMANIWILLLILCIFLYTIFLIFYIAQYIMKFILYLLDKFLSDNE